jgi:hypothetical protein
MDEIIFVHTIYTGKYTMHGEYCGQVCQGALISLREREP